VSSQESTCLSRKVVLALSHDRKQATQEARQGQRGAERASQKARGARADDLQASQRKGETQLAACDAHRRGNRDSCQGVGSMKARKPIRCSTCGRTIMRYRDRRDAECPRCVSAGKHQWYLDHRQERLAAERARFASGVKSASIKAWHAAHPDKMRAYRAAYERRMRASIRDETRPRCECGMTHTPSSRQAILRRMDGCSREEIREAWTCVWGGAAGLRKLDRDLSERSALRASRGAA
jgi:hypothetical protein